MPDARDVSGARALPLARPAVIEPDEESSETRAKKVTPAERPRKRRQVQVAEVVERARRDTPAARPSSRQRMLAADRDAAVVAHDTAVSEGTRASADAIARERRTRLVLIGTALALVTAVIWALLVRN